MINIYNRYNNTKQRIPDSKYKYYQKHSCKLLIGFKNIIKEIIIKSAISIIANHFITINWSEFFQSIVSFMQNLTNML